MRVLLEGSDGSGGSKAHVAGSVEGQKSREAW